MRQRRIAGGTSAARITVDGNVDRQYFVDVSSVRSHSISSHSFGRGYVRDS